MCGYWGYPTGYYGNNDNNCSWIWIIIVIFVLFFIFRNDNPRCGCNHI